MMPQITCCLNCPRRRREVGTDGRVYDCHDHCQTYQAQAAARRSALDEEYQRRSREHFYTGLAIRRGKKK